MWRRKSASRSGRAGMGWRAWTGPLLAVLVVLGLAGLGIANIAVRARYHDVEDGVLWGARTEGVTALEVVPGSPAAQSGIERGDIVVAVNGVPVQTPADVVEFQHSGDDRTRLDYTLIRLGSRQVLTVSLAAVSRPRSMYFVLASVGIFTLLVGAWVRVRRPRDQATLHFFWLCVAFFGAFTFSFNGPFDRLHWVFYWGAALAMALLPPLLLHFTLVFPERPPQRVWVPPKWLLPAVYAPALALGAARINVIERGADNGAFLSAALEVLDRAEPIYLFLCA